MSDKQENTRRDARVPMEQVEQESLVQNVVLPVLEEAKDVIVPIATGYAGGLASRPKDPPSNPPSKE